MWSEGGDTPARLGEAAGPRSGRGLLDLFPGDSAPRPEALPRSTHGEQREGEKSGHVLDHDAERCICIAKPGPPRPSRWYPGREQAGILPCPHPVPPEHALQTSNSADICTVHSSHLWTSRPPSPDSELLEHGGCFIIYLASQSLRLRYWM